MEFSPCPVSLACVKAELQQPTKRRPLLNLFSESYRQQSCVTALRSDTSMRNSLKLSPACFSADKRRFSQLLPTQLSSPSARKEQRTGGQRQRSLSASLATLEPHSPLTAAMRSAFLRTLRPCRPAPVRLTPRTPVRNSASPDFSVRLTEVGVASVVARADVAAEVCASLARDFATREAEFADTVKGLNAKVMEIDAKREAAERTAESLRVRAAQLELEKQSLVSKQERLRHEGERRSREAKKETLHFFSLFDRILVDTRNVSSAHDAALKDALTLSAVTATDRGTCSESAKVEDSEEAISDFPRYSSIMPFLVALERSHLELLDCVRSLSRAWGRDSVETCSVDVPGESSPHFTPVEDGGAPRMRVSRRCAHQCIRLAILMDYAFKVAFPFAYSSGMRAVVETPDAADDVLELWSTTIVTTFHATEEMAVRENGGGLSAELGLQRLINTCHDFSAIVTVKEEHPSFALYHNWIDADGEEDVSSTNISDMPSPCPSLPMSPLARNYIQEDPPKYNNRNDSVFPSHSSSEQPSSRSETHQPLPSVSISTHFSRPLSCGTLSEMSAGELEEEREPGGYSDESLTTKTLLGDLSEIRECKRTVGDEEILGCNARLAESLAALEAEV